MPPRKTNPKTSSAGKKERSVRQSPSPSNGSRKTKAIPFRNLLLKGEMLTYSLKDQLHGGSRQLVNRKMSDKVVISPKSADLVLSFLLTIYKLEDVQVTIQNPNIAYILYHFMEQAAVPLTSEQLENYVESVQRYIGSGKGLEPIMTLTYGNQQGSGYIEAYMLRMDCKPQSLCLVLNKQSISTLGNIAASMISRGIGNSFLDILSLPFCALRPKEEPTAKELESLFHLSLRLDVKKSSENLEQKMFRINWLWCVIGSWSGVETLLQKISLNQHSWQEYILGEYGELLSNVFEEARSRMVLMAAAAPNVSLPKEGAKSTIKNSSSFLDIIKKGGELGFGSLNDALNAILVPAFRSNKKDSTVKDTHVVETYYDTSEIGSDSSDDDDDIGV